MILTNDMYVPAIRWRMGEYQALLHLTDQVKDRIVPLITVPGIEYDFEERRPRKSVQEHVHPFADRYASKWGERPAWIDVDTPIVELSMDDGRDIFAYVFERLRELQANAVPVVGLDAAPNTVQTIALIVERDSLGVAIRVRLEDLMKANPDVRVQALASTLDIEPSATDLIVDLGAPSFEPFEAFSSALIGVLQELGDLHAYRNFVLIATAMPDTFKDMTKGYNEIPRHDWMFYRTLIARLPTMMRSPSFGDYTIVHPKFAPVDMRMIKAAAKVVYTTPYSWVVHKGGAFRDNRAQMHTLCENLVRRANFKGADYSNGDDYMAKCAVRQKGPGNQTTWKHVAINHHITHVIDDLATLCAVP